MTLDPLRGDPESPEVQSVRRCARRLVDPEPESDEWVDVLTQDDLVTVCRGQLALGVLTVATSLAVSAPALTVICSLIMLTRRGI